jgi:hypothetical protein
LPTNAHPLFCRIRDVNLLAIKLLRVPSFFVFIKYGCKNTELEWSFCNTVKWKNIFATMLHMKNSCVKEYHFEVPPTHE